MMLQTAPFHFRTETSKNGQLKVRTTRMYGCVLHSHIRQQVIRKFGPREGWEPFGQWSLKKAASVAKKAVDQINQERMEDNSTSSSSSDDEPSYNWKQLCQNGKCMWKLREKYDNIHEEIREADEAK